MAFELMEMGKGLGMGRKRKVSYRVVILSVVIAYLPLLLFACGGGGKSQNNLISPAFVSRIGEDRILVVEKAWGRFWILDPQSYEFVPGGLGKKNEPFYDLGETPQVFAVSPSGKRAVVGVKKPGECSLIILDTSSFEVRKSVFVPECPVGVMVSDEGEILFPTNQVGDLPFTHMVQIPPEGSWGEAITVAAFNFYCQGLEVDVLGGEIAVLLADNLERKMVVWMKPIGSSWEVVGEMEIPLQVAKEIGEWKILAGEVFSERGVLIVGGDRRTLYAYSAGANPRVREFASPELINGVATGRIEGRPVIFWVTLEGYLYGVWFSTGCFHDFASNRSGVRSVEFHDQGMESDPQITQVATSDCLGVTQSEVWTVRYLGGEEGYEVVGSLSGVQSKRARAGEAYYSDRGEISFFINAGSRPADEGDYFLIETVSGLKGLYVGATARAVFIDEPTETVWVADQAQGRVFVTRPSKGRIETVIY